MQSLKASILKAIRAASLGKAASRDIGSIPTLDGWRAVAILAVIVAHIRDSILPVYHLNSLQLVLMGLGHKGVEVFFCLSGFLITTKLLKESELNGTISLKAFYVRRFYRIIPAQYLYLLILLILVRLGYLKIRIGDFVGSLLFFRNSIDGSPYTTHFWSLAIEEQFYFIWPFLLVCLGTKKMRVWAPATSLLLELWHVTDCGFRLTPSWSQVYRTDQNADLLLWGCTLALWYTYLRSRVPQYVAAWVGVLALAANPLLYATHAPARQVWEPVLISTAVASTILAPLSILSKFLELTPLRVIGLWSYSLYLWQSLFLPPFGEPKPFAICQRFPLNILMIFLVGIISYYMVEQPFIRLGRCMANRAPKKDQQIESSALV